VTISFSFTRGEIGLADGLHIIQSSGFDRISVNGDVFVEGEHDALVTLCNGFLFSLHGDGAKVKKLVDGFHLAF